MRFAAVIRISEQCSPDDFTWSTYIKEIAPDTKLSELLSWQKNTWKHMRDIQEGKFYHEITIQGME